MSPTPLVSVIIPAFNAERYLAEAIESALAQAYRPLDVVVIDDGSTDGTAAVARRYAPAVRCHRQDNAGIGAARNRGVELAAGELIAFLDADDLWLPGKLDRQAAVLAAEPAVDMVFGFARQFVSPELDPAEAARVWCPPEPMAGFVPGALLARKQAFDRVGGFDTTCRVGEFIDWYLRARDAGLRHHVLPDIVLMRRIHDTNQTRRHSDAQRDYARILKASLDRRRRRA